MSKATTQITRELLVQLRKELNAAVQAVAKKHGLTISAGAASFNSTDATMKLVIVAGEAAAGETAQVVKAKEDYLKHGKIMGLKKAWLNKKIPYKGKMYTVKGLMPNRPKFPVMVQSPDGKFVLFTTKMVVENFAD